MPYIDCPACKGTTIGKDGEECKTCDGTGTIWVKWLVFIYKYLSC